MKLTLTEDELSLVRWCCKLMEDMQDAGIIEDPDRDCKIMLDGKSMAWLEVSLKTDEDHEILNEIMENDNIRPTYVDLTKDRPAYTYSLDLGE
jgi:hypothetical protein